MARKAEMTVWGAVIVGLERCHNGNTPLVALGEFLGALRRNGWHPADVRVVEQCVLELLGWKRETELARRQCGALCAASAN